MQTMGHKVVELEPIHGFAAETTAATVLLATAHFGMPVSTTHVISSAIMGVGSSKGVRAASAGASPAASSSPGSSRSRRPPSSARWPGVLNALGDP